MSLNDSFINEVTEEVRRDKLFKYFKKYSWIGILLIFILVCAVAINEWMKQNEKLSNQKNGDELSSVLNTFSKEQNLEEYFVYIDKNKPGSILAILNPLFLNSKVELNKKLQYLENVYTDENLPLVLKDLALFYLYHLGNKTYDEKFQILAKLSGPDRPFKLLAVEGKINLYLEKGLFKEALQEIEVIQPELSNSFSLNNRLNNLKKIIETYIN